MTDKPIRVLHEDDVFCPSCGHNRDKSSVSSIDHGTFKSCQKCYTVWNEYSAAEVVRDADYWKRQYPGDEDLNAEGERLEPKLKPGMFSTPDAYSHAMKICAAEVGAQIEAATDALITKLNSACYAATDGTGFLGYEAKPIIVAALTAATEVARQEQYRKLGIDPANPDPDGSDYHLMNAIDAAAESPMKLSTDAYVLALRIRDQALAAVEVGNDKDEAIVSYTMSQWRKKMLLHEAATIERCAQAAVDALNQGRDPIAAIRALKYKP